MGRRGCCQMWVFCCQIFSSSVRGLLFTPRLWLSGVRSRVWGMLREGLGKKWGPTEGVRMEGMGCGLCVCVGGGVCMYGSLCVLSRAKGPRRRRGWCCGIIHTASMLNGKALDRLRQPRIENACTENTPTHTLRSAVTIRAPMP